MTGPTLRQRSRPMPEKEREALILRGVKAYLDPDVALAQWRRHYAYVEREVMERLRPEEVQRMQFLRAGRNRI
ncbi:MAG: hypothetical protein NVS1B16_10120 [Pseudarthrobacter sp.]